MPEALARMRREPTLTAPFRENARPTPRGARAAPGKPATKPLWRVLIPKTVGAYAGLFMGVALSAIAINAVLLQKERHPAPLFAPGPAPAPASSSAAPAPPPAPTPTPAVAAPEAEAPAIPVPKPIDRGAVAQTPPARKVDPIGELLRSGSASEASKNVLTAQRALVKLGYDLHPDGLMGATTEAALHDFEKTHGLPVTSELSPHLIARLNAGR